MVLKDKNENIDRMLGARRNVAARRFTTEAVRESEERYRIAAERTGQIVVDFDSERIPKLKIAPSKLEFGIVNRAPNPEKSSETLIDMRIKRLLG